MDDVALLLLSAILNGVMIFIGMYIGTRSSARAIINELKKATDESETAKVAGKLIKKLDEIVASQELLSNATKFFEEATALVSSKEAKTFFANVTELMKELSGETEVKIKLPEKKKK